MTKIKYNEVSKEYSSLAKSDPSKQFVQYPETIRLLGNIKGKTILDIGCGEGTLTRELALGGAKVYGYDIAEEQIKLAKIKEEKDNLGIKYFVSNSKDFEVNVKFDKVIATLVLHYAKNEEELKNFFNSAFKHLKEGGKFVSINVNPGFIIPNPNKIIYNRRFTRLPNKKLRVEFFENNSNFLFEINDSDFSFEDFERIAKEVGFRKIKWEKLKIKKEGLDIIGKEFWEGYESNCPYIGLIVEK